MIYNTKESFSFLVKALVGFRIGEENLIRWGISKHKNTSHHNIFICYIFLNEDIFFSGRVFFNRTFLIANISTQYCKHKISEDETYIAEIGITIPFRGITFNAANAPSLAILTTLSNMHGEISILKMRSRSLNL